MNNQKNVRDGHIHSHYCPHGTADSFELYVDRAIMLGLKEISFTEHLALPEMFLEPEVLKTCAPTIEEIDKYIVELDYIKLKYKKDIEIYTGFEVDYIEGCEEKTKNLLSKYGSKLEDSILSVHFIKLEDGYNCIDVNPEEFGKIAEKLGGVEKVYDKYYETLLKAVQADLGEFKPKRIGHPTLVRIYNKAYPIAYNNEKLIEKIVKEIKIKDYEVDLNTAGLRKPYCKEMYPSGIFLELVKKYEVRVVYGSDAHTAIDIGRDFV